VSAEELATKQLTANQIRAWEEGESRPTHTQAEKLADKLRIPLLVLFLSKPPDIKVPIPDLRTVTELAPKAPSIEFVEVINDVLTRQTWYREFLRESGRARLPFVGKYTIAAGVREVAEDIRKTVGMDEKLRQESKSWAQFLHKSVEAAEQIGVLVFRSAVVRHATRWKLSVKEFRGFVLSDEIAPIVFINDDDAKAAQIFTLAHELAHVWVGVSAIPELSLKIKTPEIANEIERFCNRVAAELLVPEEDFLKQWDYTRALWQNVDALVVRYRVSSLVILRRAYEFNKISFEVFSSSIDKEYARFRKQDKKDKSEAEKKKKSGGNFWASFVIRNSQKFTDTVVGAAHEGRVRYTDAAALLGTKAATFERYILRPERS
jgi:Zn-dependent peptidase ImmA (M78 family)